MYHCTNCDNVEAREREVTCWKCGKGEMVYLDLRSFKRLPDLRDAHYVNIVIRQNGEDVTLEADWLKRFAIVVQSLNGVMVAPAHAWWGRIGVTRSRVMGTGSDPIEVIGTSHGADTP